MACAPFFHLILRLHAVHEGDFSEFYEENTQCICMLAKK